MTTDPQSLAAFLAARLDEDEAVAQAALGLPWRALTFFPTRSEVSNEDLDTTSEPGRERIVGGVVVKTPVKDDATVEHIARHDPARVLAQCAAVRAVVALCSERYDPDMREMATEVLRALATVYAEHEGYRAEWAV